MRKLFWQQMMSLDGFMEGPNRELDWFVTGDEFGQYVAEMGKAMDTILFGRVTYQMMAQYWPTSVVVSISPEPARTAVVCCGPL